MRQSGRKKSLVVGGALSGSSDDLVTASKYPISTTKGQTTVDIQRGRNNTAGW